MCKWAIACVWVMENGKPLEGPPPERTSKPCELTDNALVRLSKCLSKLLRHLGSRKPVGQAQMFARFYKRDDGWCEVSVVAGQLKNTPPETVVYLAENDSKQRYQLWKSDHHVTHIRCHQGHCKAWAELMGPVRLQRWMTHVWTELHDYVGICVHGTTGEAWEKIAKCGYLDPMGRFCVHFASSEGDTVVSGMRDDSTVRIYMDVKLWLADGHAVWMTTNKVVHLIQRSGGTQISSEYWLRAVNRLTGDELYPVPEVSATVSSPAPWPDPLVFWKRLSLRA